MRISSASIVSMGLANHFTGLEFPAQFKVITVRVPDTRNSVQKNALTRIFTSALALECQTEGWRIAKSLAAARVAILRLKGLV